MTPNGSATGPGTGVDGARTLKSLCRAGVGAAVTALLALGASQVHGIFGALGIGALIVLASGAVGAGLGFLFALPRVLSKDPKDEPSPTGASPDEQRKRLLGSNTNLERVTDWLTTMIVGVGLTQLNQIDGALLRFRHFLAETARVFPDAAGGHAGTLPVVGPILLVFGLVTGFVAFYLFTRLKLSTLFQSVEEDLQRLSGAPAEAAKQAARAEAGSAGESPTFQAILTSAQPSVGDTLNLMLSLLYRPNGYQQVIDLGGKLSNTAATKRPEYYFYLAAAFGQKHSELKKVGASADDLQSARDNAFDCARRAVALDASFKSRLWQISDPDSADNDLADFRDDPAFKRIVDRKN